MKIIFLTISFDPEPGAICGLPLAKWLSERGYDIKVLTAVPQYPIGRTYDGYQQKLWQWEVMEGVRVLRVPIYPSHDLSAIRRMTTYLSFMLTASTIGVSLIGKADIVYLYDPPPTNWLASILLKFFRGTPIVHHIGDMWPDTVISSGMLKGRWKIKIVEALLGAWCKFLYKQADTITVLSPGFKKILASRGVPENKVKVIYNWIDEKTFIPGRRDEKLASELGIKDRFNVIYAGNIGPFQHVETVIDAASLLIGYPEIQIVIIGTGPNENAVKLQAEELSLTNVKFIPRREYWEMPKINDLSDVMLVHLKDYDFLHATIPNKTQVALASARPVLMAVRGDAADLVLDAKAGIVCASENPKAMADAIITLYKLPRNELNEMGLRGRNYYLEHLSLERAGVAMESVFRETYARKQLNFFR